MSSTGLVKSAADVFLGDDGQSKIGIGVGAVLFAVGAFDSAPERAKVLKVMGAAVVAYFFLRETAKRGTPGSATTDAASLPAGNDGVTTTEKALGLFGRIVGLEPEPGIEHRTERAADESAGPFLGQPKNALRVAGAWRQPTQGATIKIAAFSGTFQAFAVLENQSSAEVAGQVRVRILHEGLLQREVATTMFDGPFVRLAPGELRELVMRLPTVRDADGKLELALYFAGFNLASVSAQRELVIA